MTSATRSLPSARTRSVDDRRAVIARAERMRADEQHGIVPLEHVDDRAPLAVGRHGGIRLAIAPRRRVEHEPRRGVEGSRGGVDPLARVRATLLGRSLRQHVDARLARHRDALVRQPERRLQAAAHEVRGGGEHPDAARCAGGTRCRAGDGRAGDRMPRPSAAGGRSVSARVEPDALERDAVPQLHDERARDGVAIHVAEAVRDDDDARPRRAPEAAQRVLRNRRDAEGRGIPRLLGSRDQPDGRVTVGRARPATARARRRRCPRAQPKTHSSPRLRGMMKCRETSGRIQRKSGELRRVARAEREGRHPASLSRGGVLLRRRGATRRVFRASHRWSSRRRRARR